MSDKKEKRLLLFCPICRAYRKGDLTKALVQMLESEGRRTLRVTKLCNPCIREIRYKEALEESK